MGNIWFTSDGDTAVINSRRVVRVKKPSSPASKNSTIFSKQIRNDILRDEFGYNDAEIAAFNIEHPTDCVIEDNKYPNKWATDEQVKNASVEADGLIALVLEKSWIKTVEDFRDRKILNAVSSAVGAISDSDLQRRVSNDLDAILKLSGTERLTALRGLISAVSGDPATKKQVAEALSYLAAQGYQDNPFILIARARASLFGSQDTGVSTLLSAAVKNTSNRFLTGKNPLLTLNSQEAAYINQEAAWMFAQIGNDDEFQKRDWVSKYYGMSEREKSDYQAGDVISLAEPPGPTVMSTPRPLTANQQDLDEAIRKRKQVVKIENETDRGRTVQTTNPENGDSSTSGAVGFREKFIVENQVWDRKDGKKPPQQSRPNIYKTEINTTQVVNRNSLQAAQNSPKVGGVLGGLAIFLEAGKWRITAVRMQAITEFINKRDALLKKIQNEMTHVVPDKPQIIEKLIWQIQEYARKSADPFEKQRAQRLLERLGLILEESYAWYGKQSK